MHTSCVKSEKEGERNGRDGMFCFSVDHAAGAIKNTASNCGDRKLNAEYEGIISKCATRAQSVM